MTMKTTKSLSISLRTTSEHMKRVWWLCTSTRQMRWRAARTSRLKLTCLFLSMDATVSVTHSQKSFVETLKHSLSQNQHQLRPRTRNRPLQFSNVSKKTCPVTTLNKRLPGMIHCNRLQQCLSSRSAFFSGLQNSFLELSQNWVSILGTQRTGEDNCRDFSGRNSRQSTKSIVEVHSVFLGRSCNTCCGHSAETRDARFGSCDGDC